MIANLLRKINLKNLLIGMVAFVVITTVYHFIFGETVKPKTALDYSKTSVMITRYDGRSGGSGVIISSKRNESKVLTNGHVCGVIKNGGIVRSDDKKGMVKYYQVSNTHDLCLITVSTNFKINTVLAKEEPEMYEDAIVSGHPHLLPNLVTYGHFSGKELITIMVGLRKCVPEELEAPDTGFLCSVLGGMPVIRNYEAQVVSATIMPGSSGSAVFNKEGELSGLVFAGSGEFGYGMIVPYEYIANFFDVELPHLLETIPNQYGETDEVATKTDWKRVCSENAKNTKVQQVCDLVNKSLLLTN